MKKIFLDELYAITHPNIMVGDISADRGDVGFKYIRNLYPGCYNCYATKKNDIFTSIEMVLTGCEMAEIAEEKMKDDKNWKKYPGEIIVTSGSAGFFISKPKFDERHWYELSDWEYAQTLENPEKGDAHFKYFYNGGCGAWCRAGYGDGDYPLYVIRENGKIIAMKIAFEED